MRIELRRPGGIALLLLSFVVACEESDEEGEGTKDTENQGENTESEVEQKPSEPVEVPEGIGEQPGELCAQDERLGSFSVYLTEALTSVRGAVLDGVSPQGIFEMVAEDGECALYAPRNLFCSSGCSGIDEVCGENDECVAAPQKISAGTLTVQGLSEAVEKDPNPITFDYSQNISEPLPAFEAGDVIAMQTSGDALEAVTLAAVGVEPLVAGAETVVVDGEEPVSVTWQAPSEPLDAAAVYLSLDVNSHGSTGAWIECLVPDTGSFEISAELASSLMDMGLSGFPKLTMSRQTMDSTEVEGGCVDFTVSSRLTVEVEVPGLISCSDSADCNGSEVCLEDLTCGAL